LAQWQVLVVDDEPDVHAITNIALKLKTWRNKRFSLTKAESAAQAREILSKPGAAFQVAMIDVVMETDDAGLKLCEYIRDNYPRSMRIILRTGQPGVAPEERVLNEYDIDHYLAKAEATPERLFALVRASLRASMDVDTFMALKDQLARLIACFRTSTTPAQLAGQMREFLTRLEEKYAAKVTFFANARTDTSGSELFRQAVLRAIDAAAWDSYVSGETVGLDAGHQVVPFHVDVAAPITTAPAKSIKSRLKSVFGEAPTSAAMEPIDGGLVVQFAEGITKLEKRDFLHELTMALDQWKLAYGVLCVQHDVAFQRVFDERARRQRIDAIDS
jgi:CheY-like chemotaxis protein